MFSATRRICLIIVLTCSGSAFGQSLTIQGWPEQIAANVPRGWTVGNRAETTSELLVEYVKPGETVENWSEMMSLIVTEEHRTDLHLRSVQFLQHARSGCTQRTLESGPGYMTDNSFPASFLLFKCDKLESTGKGEMFISKMIDVNHGYVVFQRAWRFPAGDGSSHPVGDAAYQAALLSISNSTVCDRSKVTAPCPKLRSIP